MTDTDVRTDTDRARGRVAGKVALVTGAARGQGRSHALRLAAEGADIVAVDVCAPIDHLDYALATTEDLATTARLVEESGARVVTAAVDVRDAAALAGAVAEGAAALGGLDIAVANAGVCSIQRWDEVTPELWDTVIGINLTGVWNTCTAAIPHLLERGGGSMVLISSTAGLKGQPFLTPYVASKHGLVGIMRSLANELASRHVRVNSLHPTGVDTPMLMGMTGLTERIEASPDVGSLFLNSLPVDLVRAEDISNAVLFLASDEARYVTGLTMTVDAGASAR
ncbi:MAG TPA: mycofactocin-coupled SDR family oxidoreductase [Acidimicrobiales bacterium]|nr:mycofactocin-coupled SDR family oxidoreductase [Acidimicrobiales bacterium]